MDGQFVNELERLVSGEVGLAEGELRDGAIEEEADVAMSLGVVLGVQRPQADFDPAGDDGVELQDWDAELVDLLVVLLFDRGLDLLHGVDGDVRVELTADGDVVAVGGNVDTVRALRLRRQVEDAFGNRDIHAAEGHLGVVGVDEHPTIADELAGIGEVLGVRRQLDLEALREIHAPGLLIDLEEG